MIGRRAYIDNVKETYVILGFGVYHQTNTANKIYLTGCYEPLYPGDIPSSVEILFNELETALRELKAKKSYIIIDKEWGIISKEEFNTLYHSKPFYDISWSYHEELTFYDNKTNAIDILYKNYK